MSSPIEKMSRQGAKKKSEKTSIEEEASARALLELKGVHGKGEHGKSSQKSTKNRRHLEKQKKRTSSPIDSDIPLSDSPGRQLQIETITSSTHTSPATIPKVRPTQKVFSAKKRKRETEPASSLVNVDDRVVDPLLMQGMAAVEAFNKGSDDPISKNTESIDRDEMEDDIQKQDDSALDDDIMPLPVSTLTKKRQTRNKKEDRTGRTERIVRDRLNHHITSFNAQGQPNGGAFTPEETETLDRFFVLYRHAQHPIMTHEELCARVWASDRPKDEFWGHVAEALPLRTRTSIYKHVRRAYHVYQVRGTWTPEDEAQLKDYVEEFGTKWSKISELMHRMPEDCRDRWRNYVKCAGKRNTDVWTHEEEDKLKDAITACVDLILDIREKAGALPPVPEDETEEEAELRLKQLRESCQEEIDWNVVSEKMDGRRSRIQCRYKWNKMRHWPNGRNPLEERRNKSIMLDEQGRPFLTKKPRASRAKKNITEINDSSIKDSTPSPITTTNEPNPELMLLGDKIWYLKQIQKQLSNSPPMKSIDWDLIAESDPVKFWTASSYKKSFKSLLEAMSMKPSYKLLAKNVRELLEAFEDMPTMLVEQRYQPTSPTGHAFVADSPVAREIPIDGAVTTSSNNPLVDESESARIDNNSLDHISDLDETMESMNMSSANHTGSQTSTSSSVQKGPKLKKLKSSKTNNKKFKKAMYQARLNSPSQLTDSDVNEGVLGATAKAAMQYVNDAASKENVKVHDGNQHDDSHVDYDSDENA